MPSKETLLYNSVKIKVMLVVMDHKYKVRWDDVAIKFQCRRHSTSSYDVIASKANWCITYSDYDGTNVEILQCHAPCPSLRFCLFVCLCGAP
jgi:hypothetical protein